MPYLIDTHSHIQFPQFDSNRDEILRRYYQAGGHEMIVVGCDMESSLRGVTLAKKHSNVFATVGIHPTETAQLTDDVMNEFRAALVCGDAIAVGETGMDFYHMSVSIEEQLSSLKRQALLAKEMNVPLIIHSRESGMVSSKIDVNNKVNPGSVGKCGQMIFDLVCDLEIEKVIFHCFSYDLEFAKQVWEQGYYTSISGIVTYPKNAYLREVVKFSPKELYLIETDCPFLAPQKYRGMDNEPSYVFEVVKEISIARDESLEEVGLQSSLNAKRIFGLN